MKVAVWETDWTYGIDLIAESIADAAWLARWNQNSKKDVSIGANANKDGSFGGYAYWQTKKDIRSGLK